MGMYTHRVGAWLPGAGVQASIPEWYALTASTHISEPEKLGWFC